MAILTVIDAEEGSDTVVSTGHELANGLEREHVVVHVVPSIDDEERERNTVAEVVRDALGEAELPTVEIAERDSMWDDVPSGGVASRITAEAEDIGADYVVIGSRKRSAIGKAMLGSVAQQVLINCPVPVVIVEQAE